MAEICLNCFNKLTSKGLTDDDVFLTAELYPCGVCGDMCYIVIFTNDSKDLLYYRAPRSGSTTTAKAPRQKKN